MKKLIGLMLTAGVLVLAGCSQTMTKEQDKLSVITTFPPLYSHVTKIAGEHANITNLVPAGVSVHTWQPTPKDIVALETTDLIVANGLGLEEFLHDHLEYLEDKGMSLLEVAGELEHNEDEDHDEDNHEDEGLKYAHGQDHSGIDPHVWLDPTEVIEHVEQIRDALIDLDPVHAPDFRYNANRYITELQATHMLIQQTMANVKKKPFLVFHNAYGHFLEAYGLKDYQVGVIQEFEGDTPSVKELTKLLNTIKEQGVAILFTEPQFSPKVIEILERERSFVVREIDPIGSDLSPDGYLNNLRNIATTIMDAMISAK